MAEDKEPIMIDCSHCAVRVQASPVHPWVGHIPHDRIGIVQCPRCFNPLVSHQEFHGPVGPHQVEEYSEARRVWPSPEFIPSEHIPEAVSVSLNEAQKCLLCGAYTASVAMAGRALEAIGRHFHAGGKAQQLMLGRGLDELYKNQVIDNRLYEWGKELKDNRNLAAHASSHVFDREDAEDLFNFVTAICSYVFVLSARFEEFKRRQSEKRNSS